MELFQMRRRTGAVLFAILAAAVLFLTSCGGSGAGDGVKQKALDFLTSYRINSADGSVFDITGLACKEDGKDILCACGFYDETHLVLLQGTGADDGAVSGYTAQLLDLCSGERQDLASFARAGELREDSDGTYSLSIISSDPLIVHDSINGVVYRPDAAYRSLVLPDWLQDAVPLWFSDKLWLTSDRGMIYEITDSGELITAWTLPYTYRMFDPVIGVHSDFLTFTTYPVNDPTTRIFVDVDPASGESRFYRSDLGPARFSARSDGLLLGSSFRTAPRISVCDHSAHTQRELELPEDVQSRLNSNPIVADPGSDSGYVSFSTAPLSLCGGWCVFTLSDDGGRPVYIYVWDTDSTRSSSWKGPSESQYTLPEAEDYGQLSLTAADLESEYGVRIVLGNNVPREFADYSAQAVTDQDMIEGSLSVLENVLSLYPKGYFTSLKANYYRDIVFYFTGELSPLNADNNISNAGAFATESAGLMQIAFDLDIDLSPSTVIHELTHAADYRFAGEGLLDEDAWNAMNPDGFSYYLAYIDEDGESYELSGSDAFTAESGAPADDVYFIDPYSKTFPMEDRARLMENLMSAKSPYADCFKSAHLQEKLSFYFKFLREQLGDGTWPSLTTWEEALENASSGN